MSAEIFSHSPPLPPSLSRPPSPPPLPPCGFIWPVNSRGDIHTGLLQILPLTFHRPTTFFYSLPPFSFSPSSSRALGASRDASPPSSLPPSFHSREAYPPSFAPLSFLSPFRRHIPRAKRTAKDAHSPRSSEPRLESGEILIAPIGVRTYFPRRQRRVGAEGPRETKTGTRGPPRSVARRGRKDERRGAARRSAAVGKKERKRKAFGFDRLMTNA